MNPAELARLRTPAAIRERAEAMLQYVEDGRSAWFALDADGLEAAVQAAVERYAALLEKYVRSDPYNWFNFFDFWRSGDEAQCG